MLLVTALDGTFNKQAWADHFAATLHANARETKSQADILRAICAAYKLFQLFFNSCGDDVGNAYNQKCIKQAVACFSTIGRQHEAKVYRYTGRMAMALAGQRRQWQTSAQTRPRTLRMTTGWM